MSRQAGSASRAARTARSMSSGPAAATSTIVRLVAGSIVATVSPPAASLHPPPISSFVCSEPMSGRPSIGSPPGADGREPPCSRRPAAACSRTSPASAGAGKPPGVPGSAATASPAGCAWEVAPPSTSRTPCIRAASSAASVSVVCSRTISSRSPCSANARMSSAVTNSFTAGSAPPEAPR